MLAEIELDKIGEALKKLYVMQGRGIDYTAIPEFLEEIKKWKHLTGNAILEGIKSLYPENLRDIKLYLVKQAAQNFNTPTLSAPEKSCIYCDTSGTVPMKSKESDTQTVFSCVCEKGRKVAGYGKIPAWNKERNQIFRNREFEFLWADVYKMP